MSDLYDSLEDECNENKCLSDSLDQYKTTTADSDRRINGSEFIDNYSFYLKKNVSEKEINFFPSSQFNKTPPSSGEKKNFLPKIRKGDGEKDLRTIGSFVVDSQILSRQGLQLNNDGSFTKSPRLEMEELPFITREYRNLQFQNKKLYKTNKRSPIIRNQKKKMFSFLEKPVEGVSMSQIINARKKKGSSEELLTSRGSSYSNTDNSKANKRFERNDNLTDSMKERLLRSETGSSRKSFRTVRDVKNTKRECNLIQNCEVSQRNKFSNQNNVNNGDNPKKTFLDHESLQKKPNFVKNPPIKPKSTDCKILKHQSDILLNSARPKLNYSELRLLKNGYNPLFLRHSDKKIISDTNRSNFGDSALEELPEVSNLPLDIENLNDEDEAIFYQKLIERDKNMKLQNQLSLRSGRSLDNEKLKSLHGPNFYKDQKQMRRIGSNNVGNKHISKSVCIDLPLETDCSVNSLKKFNHYCSVDTSLNVSKVELALKAKAYGYLANARNIFRLKAQFERKFSAGESGSLNNIEKMSSTKKVVDLPQDIGLQSRRNLLIQNRFPKIKEESPQTTFKYPKMTESLSRTKHFKILKESQEEFLLPHMNSPQVRSSQTKKEILHQMSSCLKFPNG